MSVLTIEPVKVAVDGGEEQGLLVLDGGTLVAILTFLADPVHGDETGHWYLEAGFGHCAGRQPTFHTLEAALRWVAGRLGLDPGAAIPPDLARFGPKG